MTININAGATKAMYGGTWNPFLIIPVGYRPSGRVTGIGYGLYGNPTVSIGILGETFSFVENSLHTGGGALSIYFSATWITADAFPD